MKICPTCREEFLDQIEICVDCKTPLVHEWDYQARTSSDELSSKEKLLSGNMIAFVEGGLLQCREIEKVLGRCKVASVVYPVKLSSDGNDATLGTVSDLKYVVLISEGDLEVAKEAMEGKFHDDVVREGKGGPFKGAVDLEQDEVTCPACQEVGPLKDGECAACGLHLGV